MKRLIIVLLIFIGVNASAQEVYTSSGRPVNAKKKEQKKEGFDKSRLIYGGGFGLVFGTVTNVGLSPILGYRITDNFAAGISLGYQYMRIKNYWPIPDLHTGETRYYHYKANMLSPGLWTRYVIWNNIFAHMEGEYHFMSYKYPDYDINNNYSIKEYKDKYSAPTLLLGGGLRQPIGEYSSFVIMGLYDVLQDKRSPYGNQLFLRMGFNIGF